jgi:uncharacterized membrane protein YdjX (TVP38/TMEM64 family)
LEQRRDVATAISADAAINDACPMAAAPSPRRRLVRAVPLVLFLALVFVAYWRGWITSLDLETVARLHDRFHQMVVQHPLISLGAYALIYVLVGAMCVPGAALLTAAGGLVFGTFAGTAATVVGATLGATILYLLARNACSEWIDKAQGEWVRKLRSGFAQDAFHYLLFLRLAPVFPFWFVNVAAAALGVPLRTFVIATVIGITPATLGFSSAGAGLRHVMEAARAKYEACLATGGDAACSFTIPPQAILSRDLILALVLLGVLALVPVIIKKWRRTHV